MRYVGFLCLYFFSFMSLTATGHLVDGNYEEEYRGKTFTSLDSFARKSFYIEDFSGSSFYGVNFSDSRIRFGNFFYAKFFNHNGKKTIFDGSDLSGSRFRFACCRNVSFKDCKMIKNWLWNGDFRGADFTNANLKKSIMFHCKIGFVGDEKTIVKGADCSGVWGLTNKQKKYFRDNGALNVPDDCDEEEDRRKFKAEMDRICEELSLFYPLNKWANSCGRGVKRSVKWIFHQVVDQAKKLSKKAISSAT